MRKIIFLLLAAFSCIILRAQEDAEGCKDNPMFTRMPGTYISECSSNYDEMEIILADDKKETKEGKKTSIVYIYEPEEATAPSFFQIVKNFENVIVKAGGKKVYYNRDGGVATFKTKSGGKDVWVVLNDFGGGKRGNFQLITLEIEGMKQDISANEMLEAINKEGSVSLQINFETGKSVIKPDSQPIIDQIAEMLTTDPSLKVRIEGHTDNVGTPASNKVLSEARAKTVVAALISKGIDKSRLSSKGWGQEKPVEDNSTEEGKAKNRRVEIVKM
jgi:OmpA-OmpF porin, OOP family